MEYELRPPANRAQLGTRLSSQNTGTGIAIAPSEKAAILTIVHPSIRCKIDTAFADSRFVHLESLAAAARLVKERSVGALLVSVDAIQTEGERAVMTVPHNFASVRSILIVDEVPKADATRILQLGACGVAESIDLRDRLRWHKLKRVLEETDDTPTTIIRDSLVSALRFVSPESLRFFSRLARVARNTLTTQALANQLWVLPSTLNSRFYRSRLPSPKQYLAATRLLIARVYLEDRRLSMADVSDRLQFSSPQSFCRNVRSVLGVSGTDFRSKYSIDELFHHFLQTLFNPYRTVLRTFDPLSRGEILIQDPCIETANTDRRLQ